MQAQCFLADCITWDDTRDHIPCIDLNKMVLGCEVRHSPIDSVGSSSGPDLPSSGPDVQDLLSSKGIVLSSKGKSKADAKIKPDQDKERYKEIDAAARILTVNCVLNFIIKYIYLKQ